MGREILFGAVEWILFCSIVCGEKPAALTARRAAYLAGIGVLLIFDIFYVKKFIYHVSLLFLTFFVFQFRFWEGTRVWIVVYLFLGILHLGLQFVLRGFLRRPQWVFSSVISKLILCVVCILYGLLIPKRKPIKIGQFPLGFWSLVSGTLFAVFLMIWHLSTYSIKVLGRRGIRAGVISVILGVIGISLILLFCIYYYRTAQIYRIQNEYIAKYNAQQKEYFDRLIEKEQDTRKFRHEITNHLISISGLAERREYEALTSYINELLVQVREIGGRQYDVGNHMINTIINYYFMPIETICDISVSGYTDDLESVSAPDLCVLISNLVKNAVESVGREGVKKKKIVFYVSRGSHYFRLYMENTTEWEQQKTSNFAAAKTSKEDKYNHGFGLINVSEIAEKYNGTFLYGTKDGIFFTEVYLKI